MICVENGTRQVLVLKIICFTLNLQRTRPPGRGPRLSPICIAPKQAPHSSCRGELCAALARSTSRRGCAVAQVVGERLAEGVVASPAAPAGLPQLVVVLAHPGQALLPQRLHPPPRREAQARELVVAGRAAVPPAPACGKDFLPPPGVFEPRALPRTPRVRALAVAFPVACPFAALGCSIPLPIGKQTTGEPTRLSVPTAWWSEGSTG